MERSVLAELFVSRPSLEELYLLWEDIDHLRPLIGREIRQRFGVSVTPMTKLVRRRTFVLCRRTGNRQMPSLSSKLRQLQVAY